MTIDLEERLRRAATVLDEHIAAHSVSTPYHDVRTPRWWRPGLVAAAAVLAVSAASFAVLVSRDSVETVPATDATSDQSAPPSSAPDSGSVSREGWSPLATAPIAPRGGHLAVSTESGLFVWGGYDRATSLADGAYYDSPTDTWQIVPEGPLAGQPSVMGVWTGLEVVVVFEAGDRVKTAAFDPVAFSWRELPDAPLVNAAGSMNRVLMWKGTVVVVEAVEDDSDRTTNAVVRLDLATEQWVTAAESIPPFGMNFEAVAAGDQIFVVADGTNGSPCGQTVLAYDPAADRWREVPAPIPDQVASPVVAWTGTELFVGGGYECGTNGRTVKSAVLLEPATGAWRSADLLRSASSRTRTTPRSGLVFPSSS